MKGARPVNYDRAAYRADWRQVALNGGPPCFYLERGPGGAEDALRQMDRFCLRAERWAGHTNKELHGFVSLAALLDEARVGALALLHQVKAWRDSDGNEPFPHCVRKRIDDLLAGSDDGRWVCKATGTPEPQDCDWPQCGCDPRGRLVIEAIDGAVVVALTKYGQHKAPCDPRVGTECTCGLDVLLGLDRRGEP